MLTKEMLLTEPAYAEACAYLAACAAKSGLAVNDLITKPGADYTEFLLVARSKSMSHVDAIEYADNEMERMYQASEDAL